MPVCVAIRVSMPVCVAIRVSMPLGYKIVMSLSLGLSGIYSPQYSALRVLMLRAVIKSQINLEPVIYVYSMVTHCGPCTYTYALTELFIATNT